MKSRVVPFVRLLAGLPVVLLAGSPALAQCGQAAFVGKELRSQADFNYQSQFGRSVDSWLSADGSQMMVVGAPLATGSSLRRAGKVIVYRKPPSATAWQIDAEINDLAPNESGSYGTNVTGGLMLANSRDRVCVFKPASGGTVDVWERSAAGMWSRISVLSLPGTSAFGASMDFMESLDAVLIADPAFREAAPIPPNPDNNNGRAWIFGRSELSFDFTLGATIVNTDDFVFDQLFGSAVVANGNEFFIAEGSQTDEQSGTQARRVFHYRVTINPPLTYTVGLAQTLGSGDSFDFFGQSMDFIDSQNLLVVGAPGAYAPTLLGIANNTGEVHVFTRPTQSSAWTFSQLLTANNAYPSDEMGSSVAIARANGVNKICAGADALALYSPSNPGVFERVGGMHIFGQQSGSWVRERTITGSPNSSQVLATDLCATDSFVYAGDPRGQGDDPEANLTGEVRAYDLTPATPSMTQIFETGFNNAARLGTAVDVEGNRMVVGAPFESNAQGLEAGAAYVYKRFNGQWIIEQRLQSGANQSDPGDHQGGAVCIEGDYIAVGIADFDESAVDGPGGIDCGAVQIYRFDGSHWVAHQRILAPDRATFDYFGGDIDMLGSWLIVGAIGDNNSNGSNAGSAYLFRRNSTTGLYEFNDRLQASDGAASDRFGGAVALSTVGFTTSSTVALVGAYGHDAGGSNAGAVYAFRYEPDGLVFDWLQKQKILTGAAGDNFGYAIDASDNTFVASAFYDDVSRRVDQGSAHVYTTPINGGSTWTFQTSLVAPDGAAGDEFGLDVSISGGNIITGAHADDTATLANVGSAYWYRLVSGAWAYQQKITPTDGGVNDYFGTSVSISGNSIAIGSPFHGASATLDTGAAYGFDLNLTGPSITSQPAGLTVCPDADAVYNATASGAGPLTFQWQYEVSTNSWQNVLASGVIPGGLTSTGYNTASLTVRSAATGASKRLRLSVNNACSQVFSNIVTFATASCVVPCDTIDFNNNDVFPEDQDVIDFFDVLAGGSPATCDPGLGCSDIDFNNNGVFPEDQDIVDFLNVLAGGTCP
jgi:hypothetical protein